MAKRIDSLQPAQVVVLKFTTSRGEFTTEYADFVGITGTGEKRRATFRSDDGRGKLFTWEAYRFQGRWAYGSSADRLSLV